MPLMKQSLDRTYFYLVLSNLQSDWPKAFQRFVHGTPAPLDGVKSKTRRNSDIRVLTLLD